jgi:hypothetical protein
MIKRFLGICMGLALIAGCAKKPDVAPVSTWDRFQDPDYKIGFKYPQGWALYPESGTFSVYSSPEVVNRFFDYNLKGKDGIRLVVEVKQMDTLKTADQLMAEFKNDLAAQGYDVLETQNVKIGGQPGLTLHYKGVINNDGTLLESQYAVTTRDSSKFTIRFEAFNKLHASFKAAFDTAVATLTLPPPKVTGKPEDLSVPAAEVMPYENDQLKLAYPANFTVATTPPKAPILYAMDIKGYRMDSFIHIDIQPSQGLALEKIVEQNAKYFVKETSRGQTTISGLPATFINYVPVKGIQSRVYIFVKNDKMYRTLFNYFDQMKGAYLPAFEKVVQSIVIK